MKSVEMFSLKKVSNRCNVLLAIILCLISCKNDNKINKGVIKIVPKIETFSETNFNFPDTVELNKVYRGKIFYTSLFDTLNLKKGQDRFVSFYVNSDNKKLTFDQLIKVKHDTFYIKRDTIFFDISFKKRGSNYINGFISDEVYIESKDSIRTAEKIIDFIIPVFVKE